MCESYLANACLSYHQAGSHQATLPSPYRVFTGPFYYHGRHQFEPELGVHVKDARRGKGVKKKGKPWRTSQADVPLLLALW